MKIAHTAKVTGDGYGYVYVMTYPGSDKVKIGHSLTPKTRAVDIGGTLAPDTPVVETYYWCSERREDVERKAHSLRAAARHNGEWFNLTVAQAVEAIKSAAAAVGVEITLAYSRADYEQQSAAERARREEWMRARREERIKQQEAERAEREARESERKQRVDAMSLDELFAFRNSKCHPQDVYKRITRRIEIKLAEQADAKQAEAKARSSNATLLFWGLVIVAGLVYFTS